MHVISTFASWHIYNYVYTMHNSLQIDGDDDDDDDDDDAGGGGGGDGGGGGGDVMWWSTSWKMRP